jgi:hypothetical protein
LYGFKPFKSQPAHPSRAQLLQENFYLLFSLTPPIPDVNQSLTAGFVLVNCTKFVGFTSSAAMAASLFAGQIINEML